MARSLFLTLIFLTCFSGTVLAEDLCQKAQDLFSLGRYQEGIHILKTGMGDRDLPDDGRFSAGLCLARFYACQAGDYPHAVRILNTILRQFPSQTQARVQAEKELKDLSQKEKKYAGLIQDLRQLKVATFQRRSLDPDSQDKELAQNENLLLSILKEHPQFHRPHEVYYILGLTRLSRNRPYRAWQAFTRAVAFRPAMDLYQPVSRLKDKTRWLWIESFGRTGACAVLGVLTCILAASWIRFRPFVWFRFRHLAAGLAIVLAWTCFFHFSLAWTANREKTGQVINTDGIYPLPVYLHMEKGSPGSQALDALFYYGLFAVTGIFLFSAALGRTRHRMAAVAAGFGFAASLCTCLAGLFYLNHCLARSGADLYPRERGIFDWAGAVLSYPVSDPEPYLLTNPLYYRGLDLSQIDDPELIQWLQFYEALPKNQE